MAGGTVATTLLYSENHFIPIISNLPAIGRVLCANQPNLLWLDTRWGNGKAYVAEKRGGNRGDEITRNEKETFSILYSDNWSHPGKRKTCGVPRRVSRVQRCKRDARRERECILKSMRVGSIGKRDGSLKFPGCAPSAFNRLYMGNAMATSKSSG